MKCKMCGKDTKLIKCHIIPKSLYKPLMAGGETPEIITNVDGEYKKKSPQGIYDPGIVCGECENLFSKCDTYAADFFLHEKYEKKTVANVEGVEGFVVEDFDYSLLKLFGLSLLWRASVSSQPMFKRVDIGPHEERVKKMVLSQDPGGEDDYSIVLALFNYRDVSSLIMDPFRTRHSGINFYRFYFNSYCIEIKVDQRTTKVPLSEIQLSPDRPAIILSRDFPISKEFKVAKSIVTAEMNK